MAPNFHIMASYRTIHGDGDKTLLDTCKYSDYTIKCRGHKFKVHRAILQRAAGFEKQFDSQTEESGVATTSFPAVNPSIMARAILFLYTSNYPVSNISGYSPQFAEIEDVFQENHRLYAALQLHIEMYAIANTLEFGELKKYSLGCFEGAFALDRSALQDISNVYTVQAVARDRVIMPSVYSTTPSSDRGLRDIVAFSMKIEIEHNSAGLLAEFRALLKELPDLDTDLRNSTLQHRKCRCGKCATLLRQPIGIHNPTLNGHVRPLALPVLFCSHCRIAVLGREFIEMGNTSGNVRLRLRSHNTQPSDLSHPTHGSQSTSVEEAR